MSDEVPSPSAPKAGPWAQPNWRYEGLVPVFRARFLAEHLAKEAELRALRRRMPWILGPLALGAFALTDRGCVLITADDPIPYLHWIVGLIAAVVALVIGHMFFDPGSEDERRRDLKRHFDRALDEAHPRGPLAVQVLADPAKVKEWKSGRSPYSGAAKRYLRYCVQRTSFALPNGGALHLEHWRAVKFKGSITMRDTHQLRLVLALPPGAPPPRLAALQDPPTGWAVVEWPQAEGGWRLLGTCEGKAGMLVPAHELGRLLAWLRPQVDLPPSVGAPSSA